MDLLQEIKGKSELLQGHKSLEGINAVIRHIDIAEKYLNRGRELQEDDLFNDVIYRTNQAFEGILKEAYSVITSKDVENLSPHQIEQYLLKENVLASRVLDLFKNYRQNWRNPSTHDHRLLFGEQEALLAIVSISAFANILTNQIIEAVNFQREQEELQIKKEQLQSAIKDSGNKSLAEQAVELIMLFNSELALIENRNLFEVETIGRLTGFFETIVPEIAVEREPSLAVGAHLLRPDVVLKNESETIVIEIKRFRNEKLPSRRKKEIIDAGLQQLMIYQSAADIQEGILYIPSFTDGTLDVEKQVFYQGQKSRTIHTIIPKNNLD